MQRLSYLIIAFLITATACRKIEVDGAPSNSNNNGGSTENTILEGRITANRTLKADYVYKLRV